jgi:hypothetical protein
MSSQAGKCSLAQVRPRPLAIHSQPHAAGVQRPGRASPPEACGAGWLARLTYTSQRAAPGTGYGGVERYLRRRGARSFPSCVRSMLAEIRLCHAWSRHEISRMTETPRRARRVSPRWRSSHGGPAAGRCALTVCEGGGGRGRDNAVGAPRSLPLPPLFFFWSLMGRLSGTLPPSPPSSPRLPAGGCDGRVRGTVGGRGGHCRVLVRRPPCPSPLYCCCLASSPPSAPCVDHA